MLKGNRILRFVMSVGGGVLITLATGALLCINMYPIVQSMCVPATTSVLELLAHSGFYPRLIGTVGGATIYYLTGRWSKN